MTQYTRGRAFEYRCKRALEEQGFWVMRAAQSKGIADLVAVQNGYAVLVQCKLGKGGMPPGEWNQFVSACRILHVPPVIALGVPRQPVKWYLLTGPKRTRGVAQAWLPLDDLRSLTVKADKVKVGDKEWEIPF